MSESIEKIYCTGHDNNAALMTALANNQNRMPEALMMNQMNNPMWLVWMFAMRWMYGENGQNNAQLAQLQGQVADNQSFNNMLNAINQNQNVMNDIATRTSTSIDFVRQSLCSLSSAIQGVSGQVGISAEKVVNAVALGDQNITSKLCECCCNTQQSILKMGYEGQLATERQTNILGSKMDGNHAADQLQDCQYHGQTISRIDQLANGIQQGFAQIGYQANSDKCDIVNAINEAQRRTNDLLTGHWQLETSQALQDAKNEISQLKQTQYLANMISGGCSCGSINLQ